jgi:hypothetical protein
VGRSILTATHARVKHAQWSRERCPVEEAPSGVARHVRPLAFTAPLTPAPPPPFSNYFANNAPRKFVLIDEADDPTTARPTVMCVTDTTVPTERS